MKDKKISVGQILDKIEIADQKDSPAKVGLSSDLKTVELICNDLAVHLKGYTEPCRLGICTEICVDYVESYIEIGDVNEDTYTCKGVYPFSLIEKLVLWV
jgi:hypothetical protein